MEKTILHRVVYANTFLLICVLFTAITLVDLIGSTLMGATETTYWHLGSRLIICTFAVASLLVFRVLKKIPFAAIVAIHFVVCILMIIAHTWISGFFVELHPRAYFYIIRSMVMIYPAVLGGCIAIEFIYRKIAKSRAN